MLLLGASLRSVCTAASDNETMTTQKQWGSRTKEGKQRKHHLFSWCNEDTATPQRSSAVVDLSRNNYCQHPEKKRKQTSNVSTKSLMCRSRPHDIRKREKRSEATRSCHIDMQRCPHHVPFDVPVVERTDTRKRIPWIDKTRKLKEHRMFEHLRKRKTEFNNLFRTENRYTRSLITDDDRESSWADVDKLNKKKRTNTATAHECSLAPLHRMKWSRASLHFWLTHSQKASSPTSTTHTSTRKGHLTKSQLSLFKSLVFWFVRSSI